MLVHVTCAPLPVHLCGSPSLPLAYVFVFARGGDALPQERQRGRGASPRHHRPSHSRPRYGALIYLMLLAPHR